MGLPWHVIDIWPCRHAVCLTIRWVGRDAGAAGLELPFGAPETDVTMILLIIGITIIDLSIMQVSIKAFSLLSNQHCPCCITVCSLSLLWVNMLIATASSRTWSIRTHLPDFQSIWA